jgi:hypothetical protein
VKTGLAVIVVILGIVAVIGGSYLLALRALHASQRSLCPALELLTSHPVPRPADPAANPSRVETWQLYLDFVQAERDYRC